MPGSQRIKVTVPFLTTSLLGYLFSVMVRVIDCHAGVLGSNPGGLKAFFPLELLYTGSIVCNVMRHLPIPSIIFRKLKEASTRQKQK